MRNLLFSVVIGGAILALSGCGGGGTKEVVKDAAYYKEEFRKATTIKALHSKKRVLFTIQSLRDSFVSTFDINGTSEGINRDIIELFKSNFENKISNIKDFRLKEDTAILMPSIMEKEFRELKFADELKSAIKTACDTCKEEAIEDWFSVNQTSLEKNIQDNSKVDESDDTQPLCVAALEPPPITILIIGQPPLSVIPDINTSAPLEVQAARAEYNKNVAVLLPK